MKKVTIVGFGRFGKTLFRLLGEDYETKVFDIRKIKVGEMGIKAGQILAKEKEIYDSEVIFYCVPISSFENIIRKQKKFFRGGQLLVDVLSVKVHPKKIFKKYLKGRATEAMLTHPMFGPDSSKNGFIGLPIVVDRFRASENNFEKWQEFFERKGLRVVKMSAERHDLLAAKSQGLTHFIGRILGELRMEPTEIDTLGAKKLIEVKEQTCHDSRQLFLDLQQYNSYTKKMRDRVGQAYEKVFSKLIPERVNENFLVFGIQGGRGSFNEEALSYYLKRQDIKSFKTRYLYTSEKVLEELKKGEIDFGQFALHNSLGGVVGETIEAMAKYKFKIVERYAIKIAHALMIRKDVDFSQVETIMTHPQVLAQCQRSLTEKYSNLKRISGEGELVDHALVAKRLAGGKLPKNLAVMGSKVLAEIYDLKIVEDDLQDSRENYTSFLLVERIKH